MTSATQTFGRTFTLSCQKVLVGNLSLTVTTMIVVVFVVLSSLFFVWSRLQVLRMGYEITHHAQSIKTMSAYNEELRGEVARLKNPDRIERIAREKLDMVFPGPDQVRIILSEEHRG